MGYECVRAMSQRHVRIRIRIRNIVAKEGLLQGNVMAK